MLRCWCYWYYSLHSVFGFCRFGCCLLCLVYYSIVVLRYCVLLIFWCLVFCVYFLFQKLAVCVLLLFAFVGCLFVFVGVCDLLLVCFCLWFGGRVCFPFNFNSVGICLLICQVDSAFVVCCGVGFISVFAYYVCLFVCVWYYVDCFACGCCLLFWFVVLQVTRLLVCFAYLFWVLVAFCLIIVCYL